MSGQLEVSLPLRRLREGTPLGATQPLGRVGEVRVRRSLDGSRVYLAAARGDLDGPVWLLDLRPAIEAAAAIVNTNEGAG